MSSFGVNCTAPLRTPRSYGKVPGIEGLYCAVGFSGHGFKLSPMIGVTMAELVAQGASTSIDISPLRYSRFEENDLLGSSYRYRVLA
jgi:glycine/D-amino acid oxidase-like deaminating enzyme